MSSRKNTLKLFQIITAGNMASGSITSSITDIQFIDNISLQLNISGSPTGTFSVQGSIDHQQDTQGNVSVDGNWVDLGLGLAVTAGNPTNILIDLNQASYSYVRVVYTRTSGSGTLNAFISAKEL